MLLVSCTVALCVGAESSSKHSVKLVAEREENPPLTPPSRGTGERVSARRGTGIRVKITRLFSVLTR